MGLRGFFQVIATGAALGAWVTGCGGHSVANGTSPTPEHGGGGNAGESDGGRGAGAVSGGGSGSDGGGGTVSNLGCTTSTRRDEYDSGFEICDGSSMRVHRTHVASCQSGLPRADIGAPEVFDLCSSDEECTAQPNGFCDPGEGGLALSRRCQYGCLQDSDCESGAVCLCGKYIGYCTAAECVTDADCGAGFLCAMYWTQCHSHGGFACQTPADLCLDDASCGGGQRCERSDDGVRRCADGLCQGI